MIKDNKTKRKYIFFKFQFIVCSIISFCFIIYYAYYLYDNYQKENLSKKLIDNFNITSLYNNSSYNANRTVLNTYTDSENKFNVIGLIEINSININYPIISTVSTELLKIAPCRFFRSYA